jgi:hypothetical protein
MPSVRTFLINTYEGPMASQPKFVEATHYDSSEDGYVNFWDTDGQKVFTIQGAFVFSIERVGETALTAEVRKLMGRADAGEFPVVFATVTDRTVDAEDGVAEKTYRVTVEALKAETLDVAAPEFHVHVNGSVVTEQQLADVLDATLTRLGRRDTNRFKR